MKKHPKALAMLFFTEMWERFSFYGMRALLMLYLTRQLFAHILEPENNTISYGIYAAYGALVYATPFIGGVLADKFMGHKKAVMWGALLMAIGHFVMVIETEFWLYIALAFLILGNGFFKPNMSSIVGELYDEGDIRRDGGFTIFYMGVNLGAFLAPLICGTIGEIYGYHWGFGLAGFGMILGLIIFNKYKYLLDFKEKLTINEDGITTKTNVPATIGEQPQKESLTKRVFLGLTPVNLIYTLSFVAVGLVALLIMNYELMSYFLTPFAVGVLLLILYKAIRSPKIERERLFVVLILLVFSTLFWAFFEQAGSSLTLFTEGNVDRSFFGWIIPTSTFQSVNPLFILILASPLTILWLRMAEKKKEPNTAVKFSMGLLLLGLGFLALGFAPSMLAATEVIIERDTYEFIILAAAVPMVFLLLSYFLQTLGELCLSPIGLSMVTKLSSPKIVGMVMGAWMLSSSMAHHIGGIIAKTTSVEETPVSVMWDKFESLFDKDVYYVDSIQLNTNNELIQDSIYKQTFKKKYKGIISSTFNKGFEVMLIQGNNIKKENALENFNISTIIDSSFVMYDSLKIGRIVKNPIAYRAILDSTFTKGINYMIQVGDKAVDKAIEEEHIVQSQSIDYSITTRYSLSNLLQYTGVFWVLGLIAAAAALLLFAISPLIKRMMHGA